MDVKNLIIEHEKIVRTKDVYNIHTGISSDVTYSPVENDQRLQEALT